MDILMILIFVVGGFALGWAAFLFSFARNEQSTTTVAAAKQKSEYILTRMGTIIVPKNCKPTRQLQLALLRASYVSTPFGCTNNDNIVFVQDAHYRYQAYYVGTK